MRRSVGRTGHRGDDGLGQTPDEPDVATPVDPLDERRPNVSGDLRTMFQAAPMFRRSIGGYSRFQVDSYVQWAEDELAAAARENDDVLARYAQVRSELDEAQQLLSHSPGGTEFLRLSRRIGGMLAAAADQAQSLIGEAQTDRTAAATEAEQVLAEAAAEAQRILAESSAQAAQVLADAEAVRAESDRVLAEAERSAERIRTDADAVLEQARAAERQAVEDADRVRRAAVEESSAIRLQARHEAVQLLSRGREERLRADAEAAALREHLDHQALARRATLVAEVKKLERRRARLAASAVGSPEPAPAGRRGRKGRAREQAVLVPSPRGATAGEPDTSSVRGGVWKWHVRRVHT